MAMLSERVLDRVRSKSKHRKVVSEGDAGMKPEDPRSSFNNTAQAIDGDNGPTWQLHKGKWKPLPNTKISHGTREETGATTEKVPPRASSLRHSLNASQSAANRPDLSRIDSETLPSDAATASRWLESQEQLRDDSRMQAQTSRAPELDGVTKGMGNVSLDSSTAQHRRQRSQQEPAEVFEDASEGYEKTSPRRRTTNETRDGVRSSRGPVSAGTGAGAGAGAGMANMQLPTGFDMKDSVHTEVDTSWKPAVTHETVHREKINVVQQEITRDIHMHHYYTYTQPIKVVEILPARHFYLDEKTGVKTEIAAPEGWVMPEHLRPRVADTSGIQAAERHYLVDEQNPRGIPEAAPATQQPLQGQHGIGHQGAGGVAGQAI